MGAGLGVGVGVPVTVAFGVACFSVETGVCATNFDKTRTVTETMNNPPIACASLVLSLLGDDGLIILPP